MEIGVDDLENEEEALLPDLSPVSENIFLSSLCLLPLPFMVATQYWYCYVTCQPNTRPKAYDIPAHISYSTKYDMLMHSFVVVAIVAGFFK
jgi:hypothetical protein